MRYVIAVAEELHFGRASKRMHVSAPSLSKQIKDLERDLGYSLFERRTRDVALTASGKAFVAEARQALVHLERAVEGGYAASRGDAGTLRVGYSPWFRPSPLLACREEIGNKVPFRPLELQSAFPSVQTDLLSRGLLDAGIIELPLNVEGLQIECFWRETLVAVLSRSHRLANSKIVRRQDLIDEPLIWFGPGIHPALYQHFLDSLRTAGRSARVAHHVSTVSEMLDLVAAGAGVAFVKESDAARTHDSKVIFRELSERALTVETGVAFRVGEQPETLRTFIELLHRLGNQRGTSASRPSEEV